MLQPFRRAIGQYQFSNGHIFDPALSLLEFYTPAREFQKNIYFCFTEYAKAFIAWITTNWKILKETGIPDHLTYFLRNLYAGQGVTVRTRHGTTDWFKNWERSTQGCVLFSCLFNLYAEYITQNTELDESQARIKIAGRNINKLRYADDTTLWQKMKRTKEPLDEGERGQLA